MAKKQDTYYGEVDITQIIGDKFSEAFIYEVGGVNFSFTDYTLSGIIFDKQGNTVTTLTMTKGTTTVTDDTIFATAVPSALPTVAGVYGYNIRSTETADSNNVTTIVRGKISFIDETNF